MGKGGFTLATYTEHYGLHQWESTDDFLRTDFNTDFAKIDAAIGGLLVFGTYTGNGAASRTIDLGFTPRAVYLCTQLGMTADSSGSQYTYGGLFGAGHPLMHRANEAAEIVEGGFTVYDPGTNIFTNMDGYVFHYLAVK